MNDEPVLYPKKEKPDHNLTNNARKDRALKEYEQKYKEM